MRKFFITLFALVSVISLCAETPQKSVQPFEFEIKVGPSIPLGGYTGFKNKVGPDVGLAFRFNYDDMPLDFGLEFDFTGVFRNKQTSDGYTRELKHRVFGISAVSNYNFRQGYKVNPYVGVGLGYGSNDVISDKLGVDEKYNYNSFLFTPRVGVELVHHIRFELSPMICRRGFHCLNFTVGFVIGGRPKK